MKKNQVVCHTMHRFVRHRLQCLSSLISVGIGMKVVFVGGPLVYFVGMAKDPSIYTLAKATT